jgi:hypothetical protein
MNILGWTTALGVAATGAGALLLARQVHLAERQARTTFEDSMAREYREIAHRIPIAALLGEALEKDAQAASMDEFFHYIDLSNEQIFLRSQKRISESTWRNWRDGIRSNLRRVAFRTAWEEIKKRSDGGFSELRRLEASDFGEDPADWQ